MAEFEIKNLEDLVGPVLGSKKFLEAKLSKLTTAGDNYGSLMLNVRLTLEDQQKKIENVNVVAKLLPQSDYAQELFNSQRTYLNEVGFYQTIAPCFREFQKEHGFDQTFDSFPTFYAARNSLDPASPRIDSDGVLLIKNIKDEGFTIIDRRVGFNLDQTKLILERMAELHGTTLALKSLKPDYFEKKLGQFFERFSVFDVDSDAGSKMIEAILEMIKDDDFCARHKDRVEEVLRHNASVIHQKNNKDLNKSPFLSFVHSDMWSNNIMVKIVKKKTVDVKFVDFQLYEYSSLTRDVIFFLFASVQLPVISQHCDDLLNYYYNSLVNYLKKFKCDTSKFSYEAFLEDIKKMLQEYELFHIMLMLAPIYASQEDSKEVEDMGEDEIINLRTKTGDACKQKAYFIVHEFIQRGWI